MKYSHSGWYACKHDYVLSVDTGNGTIQLNCYSAMEDIMTDAVFEIEH